MKPAVFLFLAAAEAAAQCASPCSFISYEDAKPMLEAYAASLPGELTRAAPLDSARWARWVESEDRAIRLRLERGEEDTLSNLLRFGVTFTSEYRITDDYLPRYGQSSLVNAFAERRADDLIRTLASANAAEGFRQMRAFLEKRGYSLATPVARARVKKYLLDNLARLRDDFLQAHSEDARRNRSTEFNRRGISLDTNLWPDYDVDFALRQMASRGLLRQGGVRRVAIVGPGLDFVNKQDGLDYYPPQTIQPFAVMDSLLRLGLSSAAALDLSALDISANVRAHLERARTRARTGQSYTLQLPWMSAGRWRDEFRAAFTSYWKQLGSRLGEETKPLPLPAQAEGVETRAVRIRPEAVARLTPVDLNIVFQRLASPVRAFDLMIGTNIFIYYGPFEQSLARANVAAMLAPGGFLVTNERLADKIAAGLEMVFEAQIPMTSEPVIVDSIYCYRRT